MSMKTALICGISGQDGTYLANFLINKGYKVWGTSRDAQGSSFYNLINIGIKDYVQLLSMDPEDFRSVLVALNKSKPDEIYYLAGQSSVGLSFEQPAETIQSITFGTLNILEACKMYNKDIKIYSAGSSECFGDTYGIPANELTPFKPHSPYAVAKSSAFWLVNNYRNAYNLYACTGILFNHESKIRPNRFVTQKIISTALRISKGSDEKLNLGRLDISRDWGWAPEYVEAMWLMLQLEKPEDFIIATGETNSLENFVSVTFSKLSLNWKDHVLENKDLIRPNELLVNKADPSKAREKLNWTAKYKMVDVINEMLNINS
ncbi:MAG: GDP-mannose 4,6-dehydratase [Chitinophagaceae bacterium]|nr:GDP-mannose 4,6-dehydratase [Chitinophagaceae bacterium]